MRATDIEVETGSAALVRAAAREPSPDSFMAGLISGLAQLDALGAAGRPRLRDLGTADLHALAGYANRAAAITCSRPGANPPTSAELGSLAGSLAAADG
ncbi:hypothetical protein [Arthrobacter sp. HS15c]|uniref:hypothetical protein n=1 Tax=Arthrobacter sp. HS15c TaxID=3230279 RepID=UPI003466B233